MAYQIKIIKTEKNPEFVQQMEMYKEKNKYNSMGRMNYDDGQMDPSYPREEIAKNVLIVELTDEQYAVVKKEVIKVFE